MHDHDLATGKPLDEYMSGRASVSPALERGMGEWIGIQKSPLTFSSPPPNIQRIRSYQQGPISED